MAEAFTYTKAKIDELLGSHTHLAAGITDLIEAVQDIVGAMFITIGGSYNDTTGVVTLPPAADATSDVKGVVRLTNHLGGTATAPTVRSATEGQTGIVELATAVETTTGTDTTRAVHPAGLASALANRPSSSTVTVIWTGTQTAYDAITTKDPETLYFIKG